NKSDTFTKFKEFYNLVLTQFTYKIQNLQCDNGKEFDNSLFHSFFCDHGLQFRFSFPHTSQHTHPNRMVKPNAAFVPLTIQSAPSYFKLIFLQNSGLKLFMLQFIPLIAYPPNPFTTSHPMNFCMVGCPHITISESSVVSATQIFPKPLLTNCHLAQPIVSFLGYPSNHSGYRCMDLSTNRIINLRHVTFDESLFPFLHTDTPNSPTTYDFLDFITENHTSYTLQSFPALPPPSANSPASDLAPSSAPPAPAPSQPPNSVEPPSPTPQQPPSPPTLAPEPPSPSHHMMTRSRMGIYKPKFQFNLSATQSSIPKTYKTTLQNPLWLEAITNDSQEIFLTQEKYPHEILEEAGMSNCKPTSTPVNLADKLSSFEGDLFSDPTLYRSLAGALQYLTFTRPDIQYVVQQICLHMHAPREAHFSALKWILRYIKGTAMFGLKLSPESLSQLIAYFDADWVGCPDTRRSTSEYCVYLDDNLISWSSKR
ncbi:hypothetical protein V2J09_006730, partial [Rumex salicifolius]